MSGRFIYFIRPKGLQGPVKIGCSTSPEFRVTAFEVNSPYEYEVAATLPGDFELERRFHAKFRSLHMRKEWFAWTPELGRVIDQVREGSFDTSALPAPEIVTRRTKEYITPEWRRDISISQRVSRMVYRTGYSARMNCSAVTQRGDVLAEAYAEAYLANPVRWGKLINASWARKAARAYVKSDKAKAVGA